MDEWFQVKSFKGSSLDQMSMLKSILIYKDLDVQLLICWRISWQPSKHHAGNICEPAQEFVKDFRSSTGPMVQFQINLMYFHCRTFHYDIWQSHNYLIFIMGLRYLASQTLDMKSQQTRIWLSLKHNGWGLLQIHSFILCKWYFWIWRSICSITWIKLVFQKNLIAGAFHYSEI